VRSEAWKTLWIFYVEGSLSLNNVLETASVTKKGLYHLGTSLVEGCYASLSVVRLGLSRTRKVIRFSELKSLSVDMIRWLVT
jgi:hypothetical protein